MLSGELKTLWGVVNAAHPSFTTDVAHAVEWAQNEGYKEVYIPPGEYLLDDKTIDIQTHNFTLRGAGMGNSILKVSSTFQLAQGSAIIVQSPQGETKTIGVRLADFTVRMTDEGGSYPNDRQGGVYLKDCFRMSVESVLIESPEDPPEPTPFAYGFLAKSYLTTGVPAGGIVFSQCATARCFKGLWLTANDGAFPMQRCILFNPFFDGKVAGGIASGGSPTSLVHAGRDFSQAGVMAGDRVYDQSQDTYGYVASIGTTQTLNDTLFLSAPWEGGKTCQSGDVYSIIRAETYGVYVQRAKGTLVLGGEITNATHGVRIEPNENKETKLSQVIGPKFDWVDKGVYIGEDVEDTQVVAMTRSDYMNHVEDWGKDTLIVGRERSRLPADVEVQGLLDAAVLGAPGAGIRTYSTSGLLKQDDLTTKFGSTLPGFIGVYTDQQQRKYIVIRFYVGPDPDDYEWYHGGPLTQTPY